MSLCRIDLINCVSASTPGLTPEKMLTDGILMKRPGVGHALALPTRHAPGLCSFIQNQERPHSKLSLYMPIKFKRARLFSMTSRNDRSAADSAAATPRLRH